MSEQTTTILIFGASGDLTHRKLIPALYNKFARGKLTGDFRIVGSSRSQYSHEDFRDYLRPSTEKFSREYDKAKWDEFAPHITYVASDATTDDGFEKVQEHLAEIETGDANRLYYLSVAPFLYEPIITQIGKYNFAEQTDDYWRRIIIEKPFGTDLASAQALNETVHSVFAESQVYRIDHYLGKETAQNILFFRFANTIFEPIWNRNYINNVQITVSESVDVGTRGNYYDKSGVLRDMFQNHVLQLLMLVAMEAPASFDAEALRNEKVKVLKAIRPIQPDEAVLGQYEGYGQVDGVAPDSKTPTFAALKFHIDNWRWKHIPFYLRSGKALEHKVTKILVEFKEPPHMMFDLDPESDKIARNILSLCIQPDEGIHLQFEAKIPGKQAFKSVDMQFHYDDAFEEPTADAYERLILDAIHGDASLFTRSDEIEASWALFDPLIKWSEGDESPRPALYRYNTWGPAEADRFIKNDGHQWQTSGCIHE